MSEDVKKFVGFGRLESLIEAIHTYRVRPNVIKKFYAEPSDPNGYRVSLVDNSNPLYKRANDEFMLLYNNKTVECTDIINMTPGWMFDEDFQRLYAGDIRAYAKENYFPLRPWPNDPKVIWKVVEDMAPLVDKWLKSDGDIEQTKLDLEKVLIKNLDWDSYSLAKDLENLGYAPNSTLVDILDSAQTQRLAVVHQLTTKWVKDWDIRPKFKIGDKIKFPAIRYNPSIPVRRRASEGEIVKIVDTLGLYVIWNEASKYAKDSGSGTTVPFEDAEIVRQ